MDILNLIMILFFSIDNEPLTLQTPISPKKSILIYETFVDLRNIRR